MTFKAVASGTGEIIYSEGDCDELYGIASLSKIWAIVLLHERIKNISLDKSVSIDSILEQSLTIPYDYESKIYDRMETRPDLRAPDDPHSFRPFRREKIKFRLPVEKGKSYGVRDLFEATLFQSKNDASQALVDYFIGHDDNRLFRELSLKMAEQLGLKNTKIGDPHGLSDGDNVSTGRELIAFYAYLIKGGHLEFFCKFKVSGKKHTARELFDNDLLTQNGIKVLLAKTATGNNRQGNDLAESMMVIAEVRDQIRIALTLTDEDKFRTMERLLLL